jgi:hypothetical protein
LPSPTVNPLGTVGHPPAITRQFYIAKPAIAADVAHVLQTLADPVDGPATPIVRE